MGNVVSNRVISCSDRPCSAKRGVYISSPLSPSQCHSCQQHLYSSQVFLFFLPAGLALCLHPSSALHLSQSASTEHAVPASLLSADGEEEEGEGVRQRERKGRRKRELYVSPASASTSLPRQPSSPENNEEDHRTADRALKKTTSAPQLLLLHQAKAKTVLRSPGTGVYKLPQAGGALPGMT